MSYLQLIINPGSTSTKLALYRDSEKVLQESVDHKPEDLDTSMEDHVADETRYFCMSRPVKPLRPVEQKPILSDPLNQLSKRRK